MVGAQPSVGRWSSNQAHSSAFRETECAGLLAGGHAQLQRRAGSDSVAVRVSTSEDGRVPTARAPPAGSSVMMGRPAAMRVSSGKRACTFTFYLTIFLFLVCALALVSATTLLFYFIHTPTYTHIAHVHTHTYIVTRGRMCMA